jgi:hypothetical protein
MELQQLCGSIHAKIQEQIERTIHLIGLVPSEHLSWQPSLHGAWPVSILLGHILDAIAGFCAVLAAVEPRRLSHFAELRSAPVNQSCSGDEAISRILVYSGYIEDGFGLLKDADLGIMVPTVFVQCGEPLVTLLLGNLEHLISHKYQLFMYLKYMGLAVNTSDLYRFREK